MDFRTIVPIEPATHKINHTHQLMILGSCFAENIGERLHVACFRVDVNPFGIQYNPLSLAGGLLRMREQDFFCEKELFFANNRWNSFMHHSRFSATERNVCLKNINDRLVLSSENLRRADFLLITFGTAWVYELKETGEVVSNCHKLPENQFVRRRLTVDEIVKEYNLLIEDLSRKNPAMRIIFSLSPIRHWRDGAYGNSLSKSILLLAIDELCARFECVEYFPSYELVLDELRDYRFYADDMLHPSSLAIDYIWQRFGNRYFSDNTKQTSLDMQKLSKALAHRPFCTEGEAYETFCRKIDLQINALKEKYPEVDLSIYGKVRE